MLRDRAAQRPGDRAEADRQGQWPLGRARPPTTSGWCARTSGERFDAERVRKHDVILQILLDEARQGRLYTASQFAESVREQGRPRRQGHAFASGSGARHQGLRQVPPRRPGLRLAAARAVRFGYLCVEGMDWARPSESVDPDTGEVTTAARPVLPSHYKCPQTGALLARREPCRLGLSRRTTSDDLTHDRVRPDHMTAPTVQLPMPNQWVSRN